MKQAFRRFGPLPMLLGHTCMLGSVFVLQAAPQQGEVIKGLVIAGLICYAAGLYLKNRKQP